MKKHLLLLSLFVSILAFSQTNLTGVFNWSTVPENFPGIKFTYMELSSPRLMKINAVRIDTKNPRIGFCTSLPDERAGEIMPEAPKYKIVTRRQSVRNFMLSCRRPIDKGGRGLNVVVAANSTGWGPWPPPANSIYAGSLGFVVSEGKLICPALKKRTSFIVHKDGRCEIKDTVPGEAYEDIAYAVSGFAQVLFAGECQGDTQLHPRTGYGLCKDNRYLVIVVIDGRQPDYSMGCTTKEVAELLKYYGCWNGSNMDGGGSTSLLLWDQAAQKPRMLNHHANGAERAIACSLGIILKDTHSK